MVGVSNAPGLMLPPRTWPQQVEDAVLLDAIVERTAEVQAQGGFKGGPVTAYGNGLNITMQQNVLRGIAPSVHVGGQVAGQHIDVTLEPAAGALVGGYKVHGTFGPSGVQGTGSEVRHTLSVGDGGVQTSQTTSPIESAGTDAGLSDMGDVLKAMQERGYQTVVDTLGQVAVGDTAVPVQRILFSGANLPDVLEYQVGGSHAEITVTHSRTRTGPQVRYDGQFDGHPLHITEQSRDPRGRP